MADIDKAIGSDDLIDLEVENQDKISLYDDLYEIFDKDERVLH